MKKFISLFISLTLIFVSVFPLGIIAKADTAASGTCGAEGYTINWALDSNGTLSLSGDGQRMEDFVNNGASRPAWYNYREQIKKLVIENEPVQNDEPSLTEITMEKLSELIENIKSVFTKKILKNLCFPDGYKNFIRLLLTII